MSRPIWPTHRRKAKSGRKLQASTTHPTKIGA